MEDFTKIIEDALENIDQAEGLERLSAISSGEEGTVLLTLEDGRTFLIDYSRVNPEGE